MSGHSKWSTIKRKKGKADAARGRLFTKLIKEITVAAREGGGDIDANPRLRSAVQTAKDNSMPNDNIERAIKKGTGDLEGSSYEDASYEGYGPGGVAVMVETLSDNKNRTVAEIRHLFSKYNGNLGENGCVAWMFDKIGLIQVDKARIPEEDLMEIILEAGATDMTIEDDLYEITTPPDAFDDVRSALESKSIPFVMAEVTMQPQNTIKLDGKQAEQMLKLYEAFDEHDDVQKVYANFDIDEKTMEQLSN